MRIVSVLGISILIVLTLIFLKRKKPEFNINKWLKIFVVFYFLICFLKMFFADGFIWVINGGFYGGTLYERSDIIQSLLRWSMYFSSGVLTVAIFSKSKLFKNIAIYICLPLSVICVFFFNDFINYYMDGLGRGLKPSELVRVIILATEMIFSIVLPLAMRLIEGHKFDIKNKKEWLRFIFITPILLISMFPVYTVQSILGYTKLIVGPFTLINYLWIAITVGIILVLVKIFKHREYEQKFTLCLWLCLILFMHYNSLYLMGFSISRLPIQLCNLGAYFFIICLITKNKPLFNFAFVANIVGTIIAMLVPDIEGGFGYFWNIHFMLEHMLVLIVPSVMMGVGLFPKINKKSIKHVLLGFCIYFAFCLISGIILNAFSSQTGQVVNYFYLFDAELIFEVLPSMKFIQNSKFLINGFEFYPLYILGVFIVYCFLMWIFSILIMYLYKVENDSEEIWQNRHQFKQDMKELIQIKGKHNANN